MQEYQTDISNKYEVQGQIGTGAFAEVRKVTDKETKVERALKTFNNQKEGGKAAMMNEVMTLKKLSHPNILQLFECYEYKNQFSMVLDLCTGGELFDKLYNDGALSEADASTIIKCILKALAHCHAKGVMHRDIKPENILLEEGEAFDRVKLADFGSATEIVSGQLANGLVGTPYYVAPEVV